MAMITVEIQRLAFNDKQTIGELRVLDGSMSLFSCRTIELPPKQNRNGISRIPAGTYPLIKMRDDMVEWSRFDYEHLWIKNVPNRKGIKIHVANYYSQLAGCVAVGKKLKHINEDGYIDVTNSQGTLEELVKICPNKTEIEIKDEEPIERVEPAGLMEEMHNAKIDTQKLELA